jgi:hypothetical protein
VSCRAFSGFRWSPSTTTRLPEKSLKKLIGVALHDPVLA